MNARDIHYREATHLSEKPRLGKILTSRVPDWKKTSANDCRVREKSEISVRRASGDRFTAKDPIRFRGGQANLYGYVMNEPVNFLDIYGLTEYQAGSASDLTPNMQNAMPIIDQIIANSSPYYSEGIVVSTRGGAHNPGSAHGSGNACDLKIWENPSMVPPDFLSNNETGWMSSQQVQEVVDNLQNALGDNYDVVNERTRPSGQGVWGGPHIHVEYDPN